MSGENITSKNLSSNIFTALTSKSSSRKSISIKKNPKILEIKIVHCEENIEKKINSKINDSLETIYKDDRGFKFTKNGSFLDLNGDYYNSINGMDQNGGSYDKFGKYHPGPGFIKEIGQYESKLKEIDKENEEMKKELKKRNDLEFQKIKSDGLETKKIIEKYELPYINDDSDYEEFEEISNKDNGFDSIFEEEQPIINEYISNKNEKNDEDVKEIKDYFDIINLLKKNSIDDIEAAKEILDFFNNFK